MAASLSEFDPKTRNDGQISEKELNCNLCEKKFQDLSKLRQHTVKCIMDQDSGAGNNLEKQMEIQPTEDQGKHLNYELSFQKEDQLDEFDNKYNGENDIAATNTVNSTIHHSEKEEHDDEKFLFADLPNESDALNCNLCGKSFPNLVQIREHTFTCLDKINVANVSMDHYELTQEVAVKEEVEDQPADIGMEYFFEPQVETDLENESIDKQVQCEQCTKTFPKISSLMSHVRMVHANVELKCPICFKVYLKKYSLRDHMRTFHVKEESVCDFCSKVFQNRIYLKQHIRKVHSNTNELYECEECNKQFQRKLSRTEHIRKVHSIDFVSCEICGKEFKNRATLGQHMLNIHGGRKSEDQARSEKEINYMRRLEEREKLDCDECPKVFEKNIYLKRHKRSVHNTSDTLYPCDHCGKEFINTERRGIHINMVHVINEVSCESCGKVYKNQTMLGKHARRSKSCYRPQT